MKGHLSRYEQEVNINFSADDAVATVYASNPIYVRKLEALSKEFPDDYRLVRRDDVSVTYEVSRKLIALRRPRPKRELTEEERRALSERFAKALGRDSSAVG